MKPLAIDLSAKILSEMEVAEQKAWDSLSRYKFQMFGYWAAIWVHLNRISGEKRANPFRLLVANAKDTVGAHRPQNDCELLDSPMTSIMGPPTDPSCGEGELRKSES